MRVVAQHVHGSKDEAHSFLSRDAKDDGCNIVMLHFIALGIHAADVAHLQCPYFLCPACDESLQEDLHPAEFLE